MRFLLPLFLCLVPIYAVAQPTIDTVWTHSYAGGFGTYPTDIETTSDGGFIIAGPLTSINHAFGLARTDSLANTIWLNGCEAPGAFSTTINSVRQTADGGVIAVGYAVWTSDPPPLLLGFVVKTNASGELDWHRDSWNGARATSFTDVLQLSNGYYLVVGTANEVTSGLTISKLDSSGTCTNWVSYADSNLNGGAVIEPTADNGYIVGAGAFAFLKLNSSGDRIWVHSYPDHGTLADVAVVPDSGYVACGTGLSGGTRIVRVNSQGSLIWSRLYPSVGEGRAIAASADGGYMLCTGYLTMFKLNSNGDSLWSVAWDIHYMPWDLERLSDNSYAIVGNYRNYPTRAFAYVAKTASEPLSAGDRAERNGAVTTCSLSCFPNPFNCQSRVLFDISRTARVRLDLFDITGQHVRTVANRVFPAGQHLSLLDGDRLASGTYFIVIETAGFREATKTMLIK